MQPHPQTWVEWPKKGKGKHKVKTNASLYKTTEHKVAGKWVLKKKELVELYRARGEGTRRRKKHTRLDLRVRVEGWGQPLWHMLLAWYFTPHLGLTKKALKHKVAAHLNHNNRVVDFRKVAIVDPEDN